VHGRTGVSLGPYANHMLRELNVRRAVLSVAGVHYEGYYNSNLLLVETERAMMDAADEVIVVADSTKFGHKSLAHMCPLERVQQVVVDDGVDPIWREKLAEAGAKVKLAGPMPVEIPSAPTATDDSSAPFDS